MRLMSWRDGATAGDPLGPSSLDPALLAALPGGVVVYDEDWRVTALNEIAARLSDRTMEQLRGAVLWEAFPELVGTEVERVYRRVRETGKPATFEYLYPVTDATYEVRVVPLGRGLVVLFEDVSERVRAGHLATRNELLLASVAEGIYGLDPEGRTTFVNPAALAMLGYDEADLVGRSQHETVHHSHPDGTPYPAEGCPVHRSLRLGARVEDRDWFWRKDGTGFPVRLVSTPIEEDGVIVGAVTTFSDITDVLQGEEDRARLARLSGVQEALEGLQRALEPAALALDAVEVAAFYRPAGTAAVGGDAYDWLVLPDGDVHVAVLDVMGKGLVAAKDAVAVSHALRLLALAGTPLGDVVATADRLLSTAFPELVATALLARYTPATGRLRLASAGHPPALLLGQDGAYFVEAQGRALGFPMAGSDEVVEVALRPGETLVLYTDGLIEGGRDVVEGLERLRGHGADLRALAPAPLAEEMVARALRGAERRDDSLCVVLHRPAD